MDHIQHIKNLWSEMDAQNWENLSNYFEPDALIHWPNTKEQFTVAEFVWANKEYPGNWKITLQRIHEINNQVISVVLVELEDGDAAFTAVSFFEFKDNLIIKLTEYWGDVAEPPAWRKNMTEK